MTQSFMVKLCGVFALLITSVGYAEHDGVEKTDPYAEKNVRGTVIRSDDGLLLFAPDSSAARKGNETPGKLKRSLTPSDSSPKSKFANISQKFRGLTYVTEGDPKKKSLRLASSEWIDDKIVSSDMVEPLKREFRKLANKTYQNSNNESEFPVTIKRPYLHTDGYLSFTMGTGNRGLMGDSVYQGELVLTPFGEVEYAVKGFEQWWQDHSDR